MGYEAFKHLWKKRAKYDIVLLLMPLKREKKLFAPYEKISRIKSIKGKGIVKANGLKIVWGNATNFSDVFEACKDIDWCLCSMALISPEADQNPEKAELVNTVAIQHVVKAIEAQPNGANHIKFIYTGSVAQTGDRLRKIHMGRIGDPIKPSIFDYYAITKIRGEKAVIESNIKYWVSLRQTFIMIPKVMSLMDPILFHQPIETLMENNTSRDAGRGLINCLDVPEDSDFWRKIYNMGGGPSCRTSFYDFLNQYLTIIGLGSIEDVTERNWFALRNFHMQYFEDSYILNEYIHNWGDSMEDYYNILNKNLPLSLRFIRFICQFSSRLKRLIQKIAYKKLERLALEKTGTLYWYNKRKDLRISAFYKDYETYDSIPKWDMNKTEQSQEGNWIRLNHGYDESKKRLTIEDLKRAAKFRGGQCIQENWNGDMYAQVKWKCAFNHDFIARPYTVLKAGHWCPECLPPPWNYDEVAMYNPYFAQVWYVNHNVGENNFYPADCYLDVIE